MRFHCTRRSIVAIAIGMIWLLSRADSKGVALQGTSFGDVRGVWLGQRVCIWASFIGVHNGVVVHYIVSTM